MFNFQSYHYNTACISSNGQQVSYSELDELTAHISRHAEPRQLVLCLCSNTIGSIAGYVAFMRNDDVSLLLDARMSQETFDALLEAYTPKYIWAPETIQIQMHSNTKVLCKLEGYVLCKTILYDVALSDELAVLLSTSGSTGSPKMVRLSKDNLRSNALSIIDFLHIREGDRPILGLPMNYAYGLSIINSHLMCGATLLLTESSFVQSDFWKFANSNDFTSFSGVPFMYETIFKFGIWKQKMPTLRTLTQAGGALNNKLIDFYDRTFHPLGVKFYMMYGQTEATARISFLDPNLIKTKTNSIGKAIPGGMLSLVDENGREIEESFINGELVYRGPNVSMGYAECASDLSKGDENKGILHTGDIAYRDEDGFYYIVGRRSRFVKIFGNRISLDHIEKILQPNISEYVCIGDDSRITIFTTDISIDKEFIVDLLTERTRVPRKVFSVVHTDTIPRTDNGKPQYNRIERWNTK